MQKSELLDKDLGKEAMIFAFVGFDGHFVQIKKLYVAIDWVNLLRRFRL